MKRVIQALVALTLAIYGLTDELTSRSIRIAGSDGTSRLLNRFNELFSTAQPEFKFTLLVKAPSSLAFYSITTGAATLAFVDREIWPLEVRPFRQLHGYDPTGIRIGRVGYSGPDRSNPPGIYVNARNPLRGLTVDQVARVFTTGGGSGDITRWEQVGLTGEWRDRRIHIYGTRDDGGEATAMRYAKMSGIPFAHHYEPLPEATQVIQAVADDPYGIGLAACDVGRLTAAVRMLPLASKQGEPYSGAGFREVSAGTYPLSPYLMLYFDRAPGKSLDPFIKDYIKPILSPKGQAIIAAETNSPQGYVPLTKTEAAAELAKLDP